MRAPPGHEQIYLMGAIVLAICTALAAAGYWYFMTPNGLRVAVGPRNGEEIRFMAAFARALEVTGRGVRLNIQPTENVYESANALLKGEADVAVVRPDVLLPPNGLTVAILREEAVVILSPKDRSISSAPDMAGKSVGLVSHHEADWTAFVSILKHFNLAPPKLNLHALPADAVEEALRSRQIDAVAFFAALASPEARRLTKAALRASQDLVFVPIDEADAISLGSPTLSKATAPAGTLNGRPAIPEKESSTLSVSYRIMAAPQVERTTISSLAQHLFQLRSRVAMSASSAHGLKAPDLETSTSAALPIHPGAIDYYEYGQLTFMERYGEWLWLGLFSAGGVSSALAWAARAVARRRREVVDRVLDRLTSILAEARDASCAEDLDSLELEVDDLVTSAVMQARSRTTGARTMGALIIAIDSARSSIERRRRVMTTTKEMPGER